MQYACSTKLQCYCRNPASFRLYLAVQHPACTTQLCGCVLALCPTRWTVRAKAIKNVLQQYESVLQDLEEMSKSKGESAVRAAGMLQKFLQGNTYLAHLCAADIIELLETLNVSLQS